VVRISRIEGSIYPEVGKRARGHFKIGSSREVTPIRGGEEETDPKGEEKQGSPHAVEDKSGVSGVKKESKEQRKERKRRGVGLKIQEEVVSSQTAGSSRGWKDFYVRMWVGPVPLDAVVDTGSSLSFISRTSWEQIIETKDTDMRQNVDLQVFFKCTKVTA